MKLDLKKLKKYIEKNPPTRKTEEIEKETDELFLKMMDQIQLKKKQKDESYSKIP